MIVPGRPVLLIASAMTAVALGAAVDPVFGVMAVGGNGLLIAACLLDGWALSRSGVRIEREDWSRLEIGHRADLVYRVHNQTRRKMVVVIRQLWPPSFEADSNTLEIGIQPGELMRAAFAVTATERGRVAIPRVEVGVRFATGVACRRWNQDDGAVLTVYPNLRSVAHYDALKRHHALTQLGIHRRRMVGSGREFDQLRDYLPDDHFGSINWKATARRRKLVTNVYRAERNQDVVLCLDCGRMMGTPVGGVTALDHAVEASSVLAHVCVRAGDRIGLVLFGDTVTQYIKPTAATRSTNRVIEALVGAAPQGVFTSYTELVSSLRANQKRRGMVFIFTDLNDPQLATNLTEALPLISRRHVVVVINLRDPLLERVASGPASNHRQVGRVLAARHLANERATRVSQLAKAGVQVLEIDADSITVSAINAYLAIKMRQLV